MGTNEAPAGLTGRCPYTGKKLYACFRTNNDSDTDFVPAPWFRHPSKQSRCFFYIQCRSTQQMLFVLTALNNPHRVRIKATR